jgi:Pyruvate/oxaloacetate carboxyltransferase
MEDRWHDVLDELPRVREELGWPIMVTPLSQFIGVQAVLNVVSGERWSQMPDEVVKYVLGQYGPPPGARLPTWRRACSVAASGGVPRDRASLRPCRRASEYGERISDELLLLRMMLPPEQVDAMLAGAGHDVVAAPVRNPLVELVEGLLQRDLADVEVTAPGLRLHARGGAA